eukprot:gene16086-22227_t
MRGLRGSRTLKSKPGPPSCCEGSFTKSRYGKAHMTCELMLVVVRHEGMAKVKETREEWEAKLLAAIRSKEQYMVAMKQDMEKREEMKMDLFNRTHDQEIEEERKNSMIELALLNREWEDKLAQCDNRWSGRLEYSQNKWAEERAAKEAEWASIRSELESECRKMIGE